MSMKKAFFGQIRARRDALERSAKSPSIIEEITPPERLWAYLDYVGSFLMEAGEITTQDRDLAIGMIEDYEERMDSILPKP